MLKKVQAGHLYKTRQAKLADPASMTVELPTLIDIVIVKLVRQEVDSLRSGERMCGEILENASGEMPAEMLAVCGLDCSQCDIRRAKSDPVIMKNILDWLNRDDPNRVKPEQIQCDGCLGDRSSHWSADCGIQKCAVDDRGYESCSQCDAFPCERLEKWASGSKKYGDALARLRSMKG
jgi:hypothetical protein